MHQVDRRVELDFAGMDFEDLDTAFNIGKVDDDPAVKTARAQKSFIENVRTVSRCDQDDPFVRVKSIHFDEKLVERLFTLIVAPADPCAAMAADSIDLIHEDDARRMLFGLVEHIADTACADADEHLDEIGAGNREEGTVGLAGDGFCDQGFSGSWSADQRTPLGMRAPKAVNFEGSFKKSTIS